jgi:methylenetetrahydrofolate reductase (NADPH)
MSLAPSPVLTAIREPETDQKVVHPKIIELIHENALTPWVSFEYFPPRTEKGVEGLYEVLNSMKKQKPLFVDFTWGAGGSTADLTLGLAKEATNRFDMVTNMHLTCTNMTKELIDRGLEESKAAGVKNILALRGDPPAGQQRWEATEGGFSCALDLIRYIRRTHGDHFGLSCAGYPEGHPCRIFKVPDGKVLSATEQARLVSLEDGQYVCSDADFEEEIIYLKQKVDAGAEFIVTQMFFDLVVFTNFVAACRSAGIECPILPGIMCIRCVFCAVRSRCLCVNHASM